MLCFCFTFCLFEFIFVAGASLINLNYLSLFIFNTHTFFLSFALFPHISHLHLGGLIFFTDQCIPLSFPTAHILHFDNSELNAVDCVIVELSHLRHIFTTAIFLFISEHILKYKFHLFHNRGKAPPSRSFRAFHKFSFCKRFYILSILQTLVYLWNCLIWDILSPPVASARRRSLTSAARSARLLRPSWRRAGNGPTQSSSWCGPTPIVITPIPGVGGG